MLLIGTMVFVFFISRVVLGYLRSPSFLAAVPDLPRLTESLPVTVLGAAFIGILLTSFGVLLQALYLSGDMDFLLSAPVPIRAVFLSKLLQAIIPNFGLICLLVLPLLFGLGSAEGYQLPFYPLTVLSMAALALAAAGIAAMLVMGIVHFFPARRAAEILGFVGAVITIVCSQSGQFARMANLSEVQIRQAAVLVSRFDSPWSPLAWAGRGLVSIGQGKWIEGTAYVLGTILFCTAIFFGALVAAERLYYSGWASVSVVGTRPRRAEPGGRVRTTRRRAGQRSPVWAIAVKDFAMLRRDLRNLSGMITPIIMGVIYAFFLVRGGGEPPPGRGEAPDWFMESFRVVLAYGNVGIALFVGWILLNRLAGMAFSQEGKNYWILKASPLRAADLLSAKFLVSYLPALALGGVFLIVISLAQGIAALGFLYSLLAVALSMAGMNGIMIGFGAAGANLNWDDPRKMNAGSLGCLGQAITMLALPLLFGLFIAPLGLAVAFRISQVYGYLIGAFLGSGASLACAILPLKLVEKKVQRLDEQE